MGERYVFKNRTPTWDDARKSWGILSSDGTLWKTFSKRDYDVETTFTRRTPKFKAGDRVSVFGGDEATVIAVHEPTKAAWVLGILGAATYGFNDLELVE